MKRYLISLLVIMIVFTTGCEIPVSKNSNDTANTGIQDNVTGYESETDGDNTEAEEVSNIEEGKSAESDTEGKSNQEERKLSIVLYYQSEDGYLIPATRRVLKQEGIAKAAVSGLIDSSINREELEYYGLYPVLPQGTEIRGLKIKNGTATIDFNSRLLEYSDKTAEKNIISSILYTLTEFKTIRNVKVLIDGVEKDKLKFGTDLSTALDRNNILINSSNLALKKGMKKLDVYMLKNSENQYSYALPVSVEYPESTNGSTQAKVIEYLAKGTKAKGLYSAVPQKTKLLDSGIDGRRLTLDFSSSIKDYGGGNSSEEGLIKQILYSMKQIGNVDKIRIMIEGKEDNLPEGTDISSEIDIPAEINDYVDKK